MAMSSWCRSVVCLNEALRLPLHGRPRSRCLPALGALISLELLTSGPAGAYDWKIETFLSEKLEVDDNIQVLPTFDETVVGSTTTAGVAATVGTATERLELNGDFIRAFLEGLDGVFSSRPVSDSYRATFTKSAKTWEATISGGFLRSSTFFTQEEETGIFDTESEQESLSANSGLTVHINQTDRAVWAAHFTRSTFTSPGSTSEFDDSDSYGTSLGLERDVNKTLSASVTGSVDVFDPEGSSGNTRYQLTAGLEKRLSRTVTVSGSAAVLFVDPEGASAGGTGTIGNSASNVAYPLTLDASYAGKDVGASIGFSRSASQSDTGAINTSSSVRAAANYAVNELVATGISASFTEQEGSGLAGGGTERTSIDVAPTLSYALTPFWSLAMGYLYRFQDGGSGSADSNKIYLTLTNTDVPLP